MEAVCRSRNIRLRVMDRHLHLDVAGVGRERLVDAVLDCDGRIGSAALATKEAMSSGRGAAPCGPAAVGGNAWRDDNANSTSSDADVNG